MSYGPIDYGRLAKELREEVSWRRGIKWFLDFRHIKMMGIDVRYWHPFFVEETIDGNILVHARYCVALITRDYRLKWVWGLGVLGGEHLYVNVHYNWETGRVLVSDPTNRRILEYDPVAKRVTVEITKLVFPDGVERPIGRARAVYAYDRYPDSFTGNIIVSSYEHHFVALVDPRTREVLKVIGEYGVAGSGARLNTPVHAEGEEDAWVHIADYRNHRVLMHWFWDDPKASFAIPYPFPTCVRHQAKYAVASEFFPPMVWHGDGFMFKFPFVSEQCISECHTDLTYLTTLHSVVMEFDPRSGGFVRSVPTIFPNIAGLSLAANAETDIYPIPLVGFSKARVYAWSDQPATLRIYVPRPRGGFSEVPLEAYLDDGNNVVWRLVDEVSVPAGRVVRYIFDDPVGVVGVSVRMGATSGVVDLWAVME